MLVVAALACRIFLSAKYFASNVQGLGGSGLVVVDLQFCFVGLVSSYNSRNRTVIWPQSGDPP